VTRPAAARQTSRGRTYQHPRTGETAWSVTTILQAIPKPALVSWSAREVAEFAVANHKQLYAMLNGVRLQRSSEGVLLGTISDPDAVEAAVDYLKGAPWRKKESAAKLGSEIHAEIEAYILGRPRPEPPLLIRPLVEGFRKFLAEWQPEFLMSEGTVWNRTESYAGTLDWIAKIAGRTVVGDTKTGKDVYPEGALQLTAYRRAEFVLLPDASEAPMPATDGAVVLHLMAEGTYRLIPVLSDDDCWYAFRIAREMFRFTEELSKRVIGFPMAGPDSIDWTFPTPEQLVLNEKEAAGAAA
jgi:hypothetical protein